MLKINPNELAAVALVTSKETTRYYLCGVYIEQFANGFTSLTATDGHRCHSIRKLAREIPDLVFIFKNEDIKRAMDLVKTGRKIAGRAHASDVEIWIETAASENETKLLVLVGLPETPSRERQVFGSFETKAIDGNFPDYRRIFPSRDLEQPGAVMQIDGRFLVDLAEASKLLYTGQARCVPYAITLHPGKTASDSILVTIEHAREFLAVIMPIRR